MSNYPATTARTSRESKVHLTRLGLHSDYLTPFYRSDTPIWHSDTAHAAVVWDCMMARAVISLDPQRRRDVNKDNQEFADWANGLYIKIDYETVTPENIGDDIPSAIAVMSWLSVDFAIWLSRHSNTALSEYGVLLLCEMLKSGKTNILGVPEWSMLYSGIQNTLRTICVDGVYADRFLHAWGSSDTRVLSFYRASITDTAFINHCIAEGVEPDLGVAVELGV